MVRFGILALTLASAAFAAPADDPLAIGIAQHAFDHLGDIGDQAPIAAASGATVIYSTGLGVFGYQGLPAAAELHAASEKTSAYLNDAKANGIRLAIGYVCATSIVRLDAFDKNWTADFRARFTSPPAEWLQVDAAGKPLPSWYGGDYRAACMNNPDWRTYEKELVRLQLAAGHGGIFFDNPTVHPQGCYCAHCMKKFAAFLKKSTTQPVAPNVDLNQIRQIARRDAADFQRFRSTIAADFLTEMRTYARSINPSALITCNNSLNTPDALFSQCRTYAYSINELSRAEDFIVVEDMATQPRTLNGQPIEYGGVYELLHSISHAKPIVAVTVADGDYHTAPDLMRLAMAEAAAHDASYLSWPTWPQDVRARMVAGVRPQADFLRDHADLLNGTSPRADVAIFLPFRQWQSTATCQPLQTAAVLTRANIPFKVVSEDAFDSAFAAPLVVIESPAVLTTAETIQLAQFEKHGGQAIYSEDSKWLAILTKRLKPSIALKDAPPGVRIVLRDQPHKTVAHFFNLNIERVDSFNDRVHSASNINATLRCRGEIPKAITAFSARSDATIGTIPFTTSKEPGATLLHFTVPHLVISSILVIE